MVKIFKSSCAVQNAILYDVVAVLYRTGASHDKIERLMRMLASKPTYRLRIEKSGRVSILVWGLADNDEMEYHHADKLPTWMKLKLAVLMLLDPSNINEEVKGVGMRISERVFWLYPSDGDDDGNDPRTQS
jgi:hypothetical protein